MGMDPEYTNNGESLLKKPVSQLNENDLRALLKPLGVRGRPYPRKALIEVEGDDGEIEKVLQYAATQDNQNPLLVVSERSYGEVMGMAYREMPTPAMQEAFVRGIMLRQPESDCRIQFIQGDPGAGKSYMGGLHARMRSAEGGIHVDCGGRNINDLLFKMVLDFGEDRRFMEELEERLVKGDVHRQTVTLLKNVMGEALVERGDGYIIDWDKLESLDLYRDQRTNSLKSYSDLWQKIHRKHPEVKDHHSIDDWLISGNVEPEAIAELKNTYGSAFVELSDGKYAINWTEADQGIYVSQEQKASRADRLKKAFEQVAHMEGLDHFDTNAMGMTAVEGEFFDAWRNGKELLLDEYNKSRPGSDDMMQMVLQFCNGEIHDLSITNPYKKPGERGYQIELKREEMKAGFFVTLTGNAKSDGVTTRSLSKSVFSRLPVNIIKGAQAEDWHHFICRTWTGLPISSLYRLDPYKWKQNPEKFTKWLLKMRTAGLSEEQVNNIPPHEIAMIKNWPRVMKAAQKLARFYDYWNQLIDPESDLNRQNGDLMMELDEDYYAEMSIDFRKVIRHFKESLQIRPDAIPVLYTDGVDVDADWNEPPEFDMETMEDPMLRFGDRMVDTMLSHMIYTTREIGKKGVYEKLMAKAEQCGLVKPNYQEAQDSKQSLVADLLNLDDTSDDSLQAKAKIVQAGLCSYLREQFPQMDATNDQIVTVGQIARMLESLDLEEATNNKNKAILYLPNTDAKSLSHTPFERLESFDDVPRRFEKEVPPLPEANDLVDIDRLLLSLSLPKLGEHNLNALWTQNFSGSTLTSAPTHQVRDPAVDIAQGHDDEPYAVTSVIASRQTQDGKSNATLHIVRNHNMGRTLIIGEGEINAKVQSALHKQGIFYLDRHNSSTPLKAQEFLSMLTRGATDEQKQGMIGAHLLRNALPDGQDLPEELDGTLAYLMTQRHDMEPVAAHYLTNKPTSKQAHKPARYHSVPRPRLA